MKIEKLYLIGSVLALASFVFALFTKNYFWFLPLWIAYNLHKKKRNVDTREHFEKLEIPALRNEQRGLEKGLRNEEAIAFGLILATIGFARIGIWGEVIFLGLLAGGMTLSCIGEELELGMMENIERRKRGQTITSKHPLPLAEFVAPMKEAIFKLFKRKKGVRETAGRISSLIFHALDAKIYRKSRASIAEKI